MSEPVCDRLENHCPGAQTDRRRMQGRSGSGINKAVVAADDR